LCHSTHSQACCRWLHIGSLHCPVLLLLDSHPALQHKRIELLEKVDQNHPVQLPITHNLSWFCALGQVFLLLSSFFLFCVIIDLIIVSLFLIEVLRMPCRQGMADKWQICLVFWLLREKIEALSMSTPLRPTFPKLTIAEIEGGDPLPNLDAKLPTGRTRPDSR
jgi:hypothetical protein